MVQQCESVRNYAKAIEDYMKVPLIQATLHFAMKNEDLDAGTQSADLAEGYVFSRSILPYLHQADPSAASVISRNLNFQFISKPVEDGSKKVFARMLLRKAHQILIVETLDISSQVKMFVRVEYSTVRHQELVFTCLHLLC